MKDSGFFLIAFIGMIYFGVIGYLAWFSPKGYKKIMEVLNRWGRKTSIIYSESILNFFSGTSGLGFWFMRIIITAFFFLFLRGVMFGIWGK